jgi:hypothetical protein
MARIRKSIDFQSVDELRQAEKLAKAAGLSLSNYLRKKLKLPPLAKGGARPRTDLYCSECWRAGRGNVPIWEKSGKSKLCRQCYQRNGDG